MVGCALWGRCSGDVTSNKTKPGKTNRLTNSGSPAVRLGSLVSWRREESFDFGLGSTTLMRGRGTSLPGVLHKASCWPVLAIFELILASNWPALRTCCGRCPKNAPEMLPCAFWDHVSSTFPASFSPYDRRRGIWRAFAERFLARGVAGRGSSQSASAVHVSKGRYRKGGGVLSGDETARAFLRLLWHVFAMFRIFPGSVLNSTHSL